MITIVKLTIDETLFMSMKNICTVFLFGISFAAPVAFAQHGVGSSEGDNVVHRETMANQDVITFCSTADRTIVSSSDGSLTKSLDDGEFVDQVVKSPGGSVLLGMIRKHDPFVKDGYGNSISYIHYKYLGLLKKELSSGRQVWTWTPLMRAGEYDTIDFRIEFEELYSVGDDWQTARLKAAMFAKDPSAGKVTRAWQLRNIFNKEIISQHVIVK